MKLPIVPGNLVIDTRVNRRNSYELTEKGKAAIKEGNKP